MVNGPFTLESWTAGEKLVLARNPYYHSAAAVKLGRVEAIIEEDPDRVLEMYESGELQWTGHAGGLLPRGRLEELITRPDAHLQSQLGTAWYNLNTARKPLDDARVRRALSLALDRDRIAEVLGPYGVSSARFVPEGMPGYEPPSVPAGDPALARALLAEAGFEDGKGFPKLELSVDSRTLHENVARAAAAQWTSTLGIEVDVYTRAWGAHGDAVEAGTLQLARGGWVGDYPDPVSYTHLTMPTKA